MPGEAAKSASPKWEKRWWRWWLACTQLNKIIKFFTSIIEHNLPTLELHLWCILQLMVPFIPVKKRFWFELPNLQSQPSNRRIRRLGSLWSQSFEDLNLKIQGHTHSMICGKNSVQTCYNYSHIITLLLIIYFYFAKRCDCIKFSEFHFLLHCIRLLHCQILLFSKGLRRSRIPLHWARAQWPHETSQVSNMNPTRVCWEDDGLEATFQSRILLDVFTVPLKKKFQKVISFFFWPKRMRGWHEFIRSLRCSKIWILQESNSHFVQKELKEFPHFVPCVSSFAVYPINSYMGHSSSVVAPIHCNSPRASAGFNRFALVDSD